MAQNAHQYAPVLLWVVASLALRRLRTLQFLDTLLGCGKVTLGGHGLGDPDLEPFLRFRQLSLQFIDALLGFALLLIVGWLAATGKKHQGQKNGWRLLGLVPQQVPQGARGEADIVRYYGRLPGEPFGEG